MRLVLAVLACLVLAAELPAAVVGVVLETTGDVNILRGGTGTSRRARPDQALQHTDTLVVKHGAVSVLAMTGKVLRYDKPGLYRIDPAGALVTFQDLGAYTALRRSVSRELGATDSGRHYKMTRKPKTGSGGGGGGGEHDTAPFELLAPAGKQLDQATWFQFRVAAGKTVAVKRLAVMRDGQVVWERRDVPAAGIARGFTAAIPALAAGTGYTCVATYLLDGESHPARAAFTVLAKADADRLRATLAAVDAAGGPEFARHCLKSIILGQHGVNGQALAEHAAYLALKPATDK